MTAFFKDGYRPFFALFPLAGLAFVGVWAYALLDGWAIPTGEHGAAMIWGVLGSGVLGFLLTAYPKQNEAPSPSKAVLGAFFFAQVATQTLLLASWFGAPTGLAATGTGLLVWGGLLVWAIRIAVPSLRRKWDGTTFAVPIALASGVVGWGLARLGSEPRAGLELGVHGFLLLLALGLLDRLLPFFTSRVVPGYDGRRKPHFAPLLATALVARALLHRWPVVPDLLVLAVLLRQWHGWRPLAGWRLPMIGVLHLGVAWIALGYVVEASGLAAVRTLPLHLWTLGGLGTLLLGMATRVTLGHGGLPIQMERVAGVAVLLAQGAVLVRVVLPLLGDPSPALVYGGSAALFMAALAAWVGRFGPLTFRG